MRVIVKLSVACLVLLFRCNGWARELDPAACAARFDVQRDKIIRTEESREMGARYLSELDVGSRHECRRLCCETDSCDVFVYEEKSPGSCYLFNCGPPEDFRCKFTAHGNFSSGVLALSRRLAELQDQERLAPPPAPQPQAPPHVRYVLPSTTTSTTTPPPPPRPVPTAPPPSTAAPPALPAHTTPQPRGRCSRYQWECHTGGECIAVYNACDGVPQCADGSDEAPELGCPALPAPAPPALAVPAAPPAPHTTPPPAPPQPIYPVQMYESEVAAEASAEAAAGGERWPHRLLQAQPRRYLGVGAEVGTGNAVSAAGAAPHIFSHKGGLVQDEPAPAFEPPVQPPWPRRPAWSTHQGLENSGWGGWGREWADDRRAWPAAPPVPRDRDREPEMPYLSPKTMPELPLLYPEQHTLHDAPKKGLGLSDNAPPPPPPAPALPAAPARLPPPDRPPGDNATKKKASADQIKTKDSSEHSGRPAHAGGADVAATAAPAVVRAPAGRGTSAAALLAEAQRDSHDGLSEHPPAAVMLLILGVLMTGAMAVLVGCRARAARRRLRRGGKPFAHDADYLVNGMYL